MKKILQKYKQKVEQLLQEAVLEMDPHTTLGKSCAYALLNGGKRFRPILVLMIAEALGNADVSSAALAVEFLHTASLIADDLPCMDNESERRDKPTVHKVFGETIALLTSYALIAAGYEKIAKNSALLSEKGQEVCILALQNAANNSGIKGATGGQCLDIFSENISEEVAFETIRLKTVSIFEISFVFGWLFGGGDVFQLEKIKVIALHLGMAFQIADDFLDAEQDAKELRKINLVNICGHAKATEIFNSSLKNYKKLVEEISIDASSLVALATFLEDMVVSKSLKCYNVTA